MTMARARTTVRDSMAEITRQVDALADRAGTDRANMVRALVDALDGLQDEDGDDGEEGFELRTADIHIEGDMSIECSSQEELDTKLDELERRAGSFGVSNIEFSGDDYESAESYGPPPHP